MKPLKLTAEEAETMAAIEQWLTEAIMKEPGPKCGNFFSLKKHRRPLGDVAPLSFAGLLNRVLE